MKKEISLVKAAIEKPESMENKEFPSDIFLQAFDVLPYDMQEKILLARACYAPEKDGLLMTFFDGSEPYETFEISYNHRTEKFEICPESVIDYSYFYSMHDLSAVLPFKSDFMQSYILENFFAYDWKHDIFYYCKKDGYGRIETLFCKYGKDGIIFLETL